MDAVFTIRAILDTGATVCCININAIPKEATEKLSYSVNFSGINSRQSTNLKVRNRTLRIAGQSFRILFTYCLEMALKDDINLLLGCNFIKAMGGGVRLEGGNITFYKKITSFNTDVELGNSVEIAGSVSENKDFKQRNAGLFQELKGCGLYW